MAYIIRTVRPADAATAWREIERNEQMWSEHPDAPPPPIDAAPGAHLTELRAAPGVGEVKTLVRDVARERWEVAGRPMDPRKGWHHVNTDGFTFGLDAGATIAPLPDGTTITAEPCDRFWLLSQLGDDEHDPRSIAEIVEAFNTRQIAAEIAAALGGNAIVRVRGTAR